MRRTAAVLRLKNDDPNVGYHRALAANQLVPKKKKAKTHLAVNGELRGLQPLISKTKAWAPDDFNPATVKFIGDMAVCRSWRHMRERSKILRYTTPPSRLNRRYALGYVPTMGGLHDGHLALIEASQAECVFTAVSIFVNPKQFGEGEDLEQYPQTLKRDMQILQEAGVDAVFTPNAEQIYPPGFKTFVDYEGAGSFSECRGRPTHFRGVATVCNQLFNIVQPDTTYIGQKDALQCVVLRSLVRDMKMHMNLVVCPTVREFDGLACSTRNMYLDAAQRTEAREIFRGLNKVNAAVRELIKDQRKSGAALPSAGEVRNLLKAEYGESLKEGVLEYIEVGHKESMEVVPDDAEVEKGCFLSVVVKYGSTRLLDNVRLGCGPEEYWRLDYDENVDGIMDKMQRIQKRL
eukprot:TRINITY_DN15404_c0_g1_i1.p1 TRINITY_DN15404_c0_g1~~TRINITY_DN15404_c0_g1_i1.p1  ORF type:complete len:405 (+),score=141.23 TRINITY_DN15404_c0_g1_i1:69-1283(+)